ncbi:hypothetical protein ACVILH_002319 [Bradyrhizobium sp. USDA 4353]
MAVIVMAVIVIVMAAVLVMHVIIMRMIVTVTMVRVTMRAVTMMMIVIMTVVIMAMMIMIIMSMAWLGVGAALWIERRLDLDDARAETLHHRLDHMIAADAQALGQELRRQMPVAEMPGKPHQMLRIAGADLQQRLGRRDDLDQPAVLQHQGIATAQRGGVLEVEQEFEPARARHRHAAAVTIVEIEQDGIGSRLFPTMLPEHARGADHADILILSSARSIPLSGHRPSRA